MISFGVMQKVRNCLDLWETPVTWMYLDSEGCVTVGCGTMLPDAASAGRIPFFHSKTLQLATQTEIEAIWTDLHLGMMEQRGKSAAKKFSAKHYEHITELRITKATAELLRDTHILADYVELKRIYHQFDAFPDNAKVAVFDMIYNLGPGSRGARHHRASGLRKYMQMNAALNEGKWSLAADRCLRHGISAERNRMTAMLLKNCHSTTTKPLEFVHVVR